jgi:hypothetical protein
VTQRRQIIELAREIRDLYVRSCALATRYNETLNADARELRDACRARPQKLVPELEYFENIFDRHEAMQKAMAHPRVKLRQQIIGTALWLVIFALAWQGLQVGGSLLGGLIVPTVLAVAAIVIHQRLILGSAPFRRCLREQLVARGVPICVGCGYDLRGQVEPRCSECGERAPHLRNRAAGETRGMGGMAHVR